MFSCRTRGFCPSCHAKRIDDSRLTEIFAREVLAMLVRKELLSPEWAERILSWPHSGFNVHGGRGPRLCLGIHFRRTHPWIRTRASGEPKARPWQPGPGQDEDRGRAAGEVHAPAGARLGAADISGTRGQGRLSLGP